MALLEPEDSADEGVSAPEEKLKEAEAGPQPAERSIRDFVRELTRREFTAASPAIREHLQAFFATHGLCQDDLAGVSLSALSHDPVLKELLTASASHGAPKERLLSPAALKALDDPLLHAALRKGIVKTLSWEALLTALRRSYLDLALEAAPRISRPAHLRVLVSLACQCFNNEYVYFEEPAEEKLMATLAEQVEQALKRAPSTWAPETLAQLCCYAAYRPLGTLGCSASLAAYDWSSHEQALCDLIRNQLLEPMEEARLRNQIPTLGMSENPVTKRVRRRYEESPFPRWLNLEIPSRKSLEEILRANVSPAPRVKGPTDSLDILVAGCGTGRDPIYHALRYKNSRVTAIDLSLTSLGYAARKAAEYGVANLKFWHGDILALGRRDWRFHMAESVGVLHHMEDPESGLRVLASRLHPGGFLRLGLYSRLARGRFAAARELVRKREFTDAPEDVRLCRKEILSAPPASELAEIWNYTDFFTLSQFRDLLFHPHQRELYLNEIADMLQRTGLRFLGFENVADETLEEFQRLFPQAGATTDLALWDRFERQHPHTFESLYVFWASNAA